MKTYFVKGYGYLENGSKFEFTNFFDLEDVSAASFMQAVEDFASQMPGYKRGCVVESVVVLN